MNWKVEITPIGLECLDKLDKKIRERVFEKLKWLSENFEEQKTLPLHYDWRGYFKLRVGDWRILFNVRRESQKIIVHLVDKRDKIYKKK